MNVDTIGSQGGFGQQQVKPAESVETERKAKESMAGAEPQATESAKIQPEEILDQIKSVTQDGAYSVRFEQDNEFDELIVKIFDNDTQEVIRQMPAEEVLNFKATFQELIGNMVDTKG